MKLRQQSKKIQALIYLFLGHLLFFGLAVLSLKYFKERVIYVDSAFQVFKWIYEDTLSIEAHRYSAILPQLIIKLVRNFGVDLAFLLKTASLTHVLIPWIVFSFCAHVLKRPWIAVSCALAAVLCTRLSFYSVVLEIHYLLSYPFLILAAISIRQKRFWINEWAKNLSAVIVVLMTLLVHPVGVILTVYVLVFWLLISNRNKKLVFGLLVLSLIWALFGRVIFPPTEYEDGLYNSLLHGINQISNFSELPSFRLLIDHTWDLTHHYLFVWFALLAALFLAAYRGAWYLMSFVLLSFVGFVFLTVITYFEGESAIMLEKSYLPLSTMLAIPVVYEFYLLRSRWRWMALIPFTVVLFFQFRAISFASRPMTDRFDSLEMLVREVQHSNQNSVLVPEKVLVANGILINWALPFEAVLCSSLSSQDSTVLLFAEKPEYNGVQSNILFTNWNIEPSGTQSSKKYFSIPEGKMVHWNELNQVTKETIE